MVAEMLQPAAPALVPLGVVPAPDGRRIVALSADARGGTAPDELQPGDRAIHARLIAAQEAERARIARDLHDVVGQALTAVRLNLLWLERVNARTGASGAEISDSIAAVDAALQQVRTAAFDLRPAVLDDLGLAAALRSLCRQVALRSDMDISCRVAIGGGRLPAEIETTCFRIAQEAITNVVRHARARRVTVSVRLRPRSGVLVLEVSDDGVGFDPTGCSSAMSLGLSGMAERASLVGGLVEVRSGTGKGTSMIARLRVRPPPNVIG
jgi:signal transduction histidine kinase